MMRFINLTRIPRLFANVHVLRTGSADGEFLDILYIPILYNLKFAAIIKVCDDLASRNGCAIEMLFLMGSVMLKTDENSRLSLSWNLNREIAKINYRIHTDAIKGNLIPPELTPEQISYTYASEADLLNVALFGQRAKQWRGKNPGKKGNMQVIRGCGK